MNCWAELGQTGRSRKGSFAGEPWPLAAPADIRARAGKPAQREPRVRTPSMADARSPDLSAADAACRGQWHAGGGEAHSRRCLAVPLDGGVVLADGRPCSANRRPIRGVLLAISRPQSSPRCSARLEGWGCWRGRRDGGRSLIELHQAAARTCRRAARPSASIRSPNRVLATARLPAALAADRLDIVVTVVLFFVGEIVLSRLLFRLRLRDRPY